MNNGVTFSARMLNLHKVQNRFFGSSKMYAPHLRVKYVCSYLLIEIFKIE